MGMKSHVETCFEWVFATGGHGESSGGTLINLLLGTQEPQRFSAMGPRTNKILPF